MRGVRVRGGLCRMVCVVGMVTLATFSVTLAAPGDLHISYDGWQVLEVDLKGRSEEVNLLEFDDTFNLQLLRQNNRKGVAEVAVSPKGFADFTQHLQNISITFRTAVEDLGSELASDGYSLRAEPVTPGTVTFERYMSYEEIVAYLEELPSLHPELVTLKQVGRSVEGRPLYLLTITSSSSTNNNKPIVFIDGGIHAREWISPSAALNVVGRLLESPSLTRDVEWRVMPLLNPDGYIHTWTKDRLWRKNRAQTSSANCPGVDLNRNFDFHWGETGTSSKPCSSIYMGPEPFSEPEARALRDTLLKDKSRTQAYVSIHSYGQFVLHPWGYTSTVVRSNADRLGSVGRGMAQAILEGEGVAYSVGSPGQILYPAAGASDDFAAGVGDIPLVYTIELRDEGRAGFILPSELILPTVNDAWLAIRYLGHQVIPYGTRESINGLIVTTDASVDPETTTEGAEVETTVHPLELDDSPSEAVTRVYIAPVEPQDTTKEGVLSDTVPSVQFDGTTEEAVLPENVATTIPENTAEEAVVSVAIASVETEDTDTTVVERHDASIELTTEAVLPNIVATPVLSDTFGLAEPDIVIGVLSNTDVLAGQDIATAVLSDAEVPKEQDVAIVVLSDTVNPAKPDISTAVLSDTVNPAKPDISTAVLSDTVNPAKPDISTAVLTDTVNPAKPDISIGESVVEEGQEGFYTKVRIQKPEEVPAGTQPELSGTQEDEAITTYTRVSSVSGEGVDEGEDDHTVVGENVEHHRDVYHYSSEHSSHSDEDSDETRNGSDEQKDRHRNRSDEQKDRHRNRSDEQKDRHRNRSDEQKDSHRNRSDEQKDRSSSEKR